MYSEMKGNSQVLIKCHFSDTSTNVTQDNHLLTCVVCLCESNAVCCFSFAEVVADETPAVDAVLKADTKRLALLEEVCVYHHVNMTVLGSA